MHGTGFIRGAAAIVVTALWVCAGCGRTDVAGQPASSAAPIVQSIAPTSTTTTTTSPPAPPPRPIHPQVASHPVIARIVTTPHTGPDPGDMFDRLASCESGGNWSDRDSPTYRGGLQFSYSTWRSVGGSGDPADASRDEQISRARTLQQRSGWGQWPACSRRLGLR